MNMPSPALADYLSRARAFTPDDAEQFRELLSEGSALLELEPVELCEWFSIPLAVAEQWVAGQVLPPVFARARLIARLAERCRTSRTAQRRSS